GGGDSGNRNEKQMWRRSRGAESGPSRLGETTEFPRRAPVLSPHNPLFAPFASLSSRSSSLSWRAYCRYHHANPARTISWFRLLGLREHKEARHSLFSPAMSQHQTIDPLAQI